tara:strand:+ start:6321 stop:7784 length:1464 start_codon:yes stop_codon:yes gene_type:complete
MSPKCLLISPLRGEEKHPANPLATSQRFLNFGVLSLASYLNRKGISTIVLDEYSLDPKRELLDEIIFWFGAECPLLVGVSSISSYSAERTQHILSKSAKYWPEVPRVIGGQHFVGYWGDQFAKFMPEADILIAGEAEDAMFKILNALQNGVNLQSLEPSKLPTNVFWKSNQIIQHGKLPASTSLPIDELINVDYSLYPGSELLFPSVEFSRGCPFSCVFCANSRENRLGYRRASALNLAQAVLRLMEMRQERPVQFYLQASNFSVTVEESKSITEALLKNGEIAHWRTEIRVDGVQKEALKNLAKAGLQVLDLGLESASPRILKIMHKTANPILYLKQAENVLREATNCGIFTKVNFLIHPGDTIDTVEESWDWLRSHADIISGISSGVTLEYPGTQLSKNMERYELEFGTKRIEHPLSNWGVYFLEPSSSLSYDKAEELSVKIAQSLQTRANFAKSKSFGYIGVKGSADQILSSLPEASHETPYRK